MSVVCWAVVREGPFGVGLEVELEEDVVDCAVEPVNVRTRGASLFRELRLYQSLKPGVVCRNIRPSAITSPRESYLFIIFCNICR